MNKSRKKLATTQLPDYLEPIQQRIQQLDHALVIAEKRKKNAPEGKVHMMLKKGRPEYYYRTESTDRTGRYLKKKEEKLIRRLLQKGYDESVIKAIEAERKILLKLLEQYTKCLKLAEDIYDELPQVIKSEVEADILPSQTFAELWQAETFIPKSFLLSDSSGYYTAKSERVRSKSEILICNELQRQNIPYHYEKPLYLDTGRTVYPDFTVLNPRTRQVFYWEHMGMLDDANYRAHALQKILDYERNGIFPGKHLILTHETESEPLSSAVIEAQIRAYLI